MAKRQKSGPGFIFGLMVGLVAGAAIAILLTPQTGEQTRGQLSVQLRERYGEAFEQGREAYERTKDEVISRYNQAKTGQ